MSDLKFVENEDVLDWVLTRMTAAGYPLTRGDVGPASVMGVSRDGKPLAGAVYNWFRPHPRHLNANDVNVIFAVEPGARFRKKDVFPKLFAHAYDTLKCGRMTAIIGESNKTSVKLVKRLGFQKEGVIRRGYDGKMNALVYGQLKHECPFYEVSNG